MNRINTNVSQADISRMTGLSKATVCMALSGNSKIKETTRNQVLTAAKNLNYSRTANPEARRLVAKRLGKSIRFESIGLIWPKKYAMHDYPFYLELLHGFVEGCWDIGCSLVLINLDMDNLQEIKQITSLSHIDGLIIPIPSEEHTEYVKTLGLPLITTYFERPEISSVSIDHTRAVRLAVQHLCDKGHREIAYLAPSLNVSQTTMRLRSYRQCLDKNEIIYRPECVVCDGGSDSPNFGNMNFKKLWKSVKPTAILAYNDTFAGGIINAANELGVKVGEELSIIGIDGTPESAHTTPPLTTISIGLKKMGRKAVELLEECISEQEYEVKRISMPLELIERESVATLNQE